MKTAWFVFWTVLLVLSAGAVVAGERPLPERALAAEAASDWATAVEIYRGLLEHEPGRVDLWLRTADLEAARGKRAAAAAALARAAELAPADGELQLRSARAYAAAGAREPALDAIRRALELDPDNVEALRAGAHLASWNSDYDLARECYRRLLALLGDDQAAALGLARVESWSGRATDAVRAYQDYVAAYPDDATARLEYARAESWRGNAPAAMAILDTYKSDFGESTDYLLDRARVLTAGERPRAALAILEPMARTEPESAAVQGLYPLALSGGGRPGEALASLDRLRQTAPDHAELRTVERVVETPMRSVLVPELDFYRDADSVERVAVKVGGEVQLAPRSRLFLDLVSDELRADRGSGLEARGGATIRTSALWAGIDARPASWLELDARLGEVEIDGGGDLLAYRLGAAFDLGDSLRLRLERRRGYHAVSPRALDLGIDRTTQEAALRWRPDLRHVIETSVAYATFSDGNRLWEAVVAPRRSVLRRERFNLDLGLRAWWFAFDRDLGNGYYDPGSYQRYTVTSFGYWKLSDNDGVGFVGGFGVFRDDTMDEFRFGGDLNVEFTLGLYRDWILRIRGGYTENSRLATGAFSAYGGALSLGRRF